MNLQIVFEWIYLVYGIGIFLIFIGVRIVLNIIRKRTIKELNRLLYKEENFFLFFELLKNKRLRLVFTKARIALFELEGYLLAGIVEEIENLIHFIDELRLEPDEKLDFRKKRFSYYISTNNSIEAKRSLKLLKSVFKKQTSETLAIINEAELIYNIYINHDTSLIPQLEELARSEVVPIVRGITEYRLAKLYYFSNNKQKVKEYLEKAKTNVQSTYWYPIVLEALRDHKILASK